ncbi:MAG TPA: hypothetical protein VHE34_04360 [Puia sp.]|uniref:hypothetical protein n=1 Tax=Puia sp. TaxID=2045100 RepID=UPI002C470182|nr:hypothetical protein [Puia sp.]HVU94429.1 hypothetical protein [Puia sp.]
MRTCTVNLLITILICLDAKAGTTLVQYRNIPQVRHTRSPLATNRDRWAFLLDWSIFVRHALKRPDWRGADNIAGGKSPRERYMNPETILARIRE